jgi:shikimate kinase
MKKQNITFIGMAGVGKSAVGKIVADSLGWKFIDIDTLLEARYNSSLQTILDDVGDEKFIELETKEIETIHNVVGHVIAPGGSVVYSDHAMKTLKEISKVVYLTAPPLEIEKRITTHTRGIVGMKNKTFREVYEEREYLYRKYADVVVVTEGKEPSSIAEEILKSVL